MKYTEYKDISLEDLVNKNLTGEISKDQAIWQAKTELEAMNKDCLKDIHQLSLQIEFDDEMRKDVTPEIHQQHLEEQKVLVATQNMLESDIKRATNMYLSELCNSKEVDAVVPGETKYDFMHNEFAHDNPALKYDIKRVNLDEYILSNYPLDMIISVLCKLNYTYLESVVSVNEALYNEIKKIEENLSQSVNINPNDMIKLAEKTVQEEKRETLKNKVEELTDGYTQTCLDVLSKRVKSSDSKQEREIINRNADNIFYVASNYLCQTRIGGVVKNSPFISVDQANKVYQACIERDREIRAQLGNQ